MTATVPGSASLSRPRTSSPSIPGIFTSRKTTSGWKVLAVSSASMPSDATATWWSSYSKSWRTARWIDVSSSTIRILAISLARDQHERVPTHERGAETSRERHPDGVGRQTRSVPPTEGPQDLRKEPRRERNPRCLHAIDVQRGLLLAERLERALHLHLDGI